MKYKGVTHLKQLGHPVREICNLLQVSSSGFYTGTSAKLSSTEQRNKELTAMIGNAFYKHKRAYGHPRIHKELQNQGEELGRRRVARIMRELELRALSKKAFRPKTTQSDPNAPKAERVFKVESSVVTRPNQVWASDLTYIPREGGGQMYLVVVIDLYDRSIRGWDVSDSMLAENTDRALLRALQGTSGSVQGLIFHSDRGSQYTSECVRKRLKLLGIIQSMSRPGNCYDNAFAESLFHTLKNELPKQRFKSLEEATQVLFAYIGWYNTKRLHSALGYVSPREYRRTFEERNV